MHLFIKLRGGGEKVKLWILPPSPNTPLEIPWSALWVSSVMLPRSHQHSWGACNAPVKTSVPLQRDLTSPSSGESHEQSQCFALQLHAISGLWVMPIVIWANVRGGGRANLSVYFEILLGSEFLDLNQQSVPDHSAFCCCCTPFLFSGVTCSHARMCMTPQVSLLSGEKVTGECEGEGGGEKESLLMHQMSKVSVRYFQLQWSLSSGCLQL